MPSSALTRSTFGTLLKQSKFSSFDPRISQVYTTHGGDAHRGQWGFKRPLPLRRRGAYITVKNVDTAEHQTEWNSAEPQALWIKNWDELKLTPASAEWSAEVEHITDSDYSRKRGDAADWRQAYIPNLEAMSRKEFGDYLGKIRAHRDRFLKGRTSAEVTSYQLSHQSKTYVPWSDAIAAELSRRRRGNARSREMEDVPHISGGLSYGQYPPLQTYLMTTERKGRLADEHRGKDQNMMHYVASFGGMAGRVPKGQSGRARPVEWGDGGATGEALMRVQKAVVRAWPRVVGERQGLKAARVDVSLRVSDGQAHARSNPHPPGSRAYIAAEPPQSVQSLAQTAAAGRAAWAGRQRRHGTTLSLLESALSR